MPANLTPEYDRAEDRYRDATDDDEKLNALRAMLSAIPKHKGTEKMQADIKRRISQLRKAAAKKGPSRGPDPFHVPRTGAGQVVLIGYPNVGKSTLVSVTTNAPVKVAPYPYTTALPVPGMWFHEDVQIQLVDTPPMTAEHVPAGLMSTIRLADLICIVLDASVDPLNQVQSMIKMLTNRGLTLRSVPRNELDRDDLSQYSAILVASKSDLIDPQDITTLRESYGGKLEIHPVSATTGEGLEPLLKRMWELLAIIRVYTKQPGKPPDNEKPFTLPVGSTVEDLARDIHRELPEKMKYARIWGEGRYDGQQVQRTETLHDKDTVEIRE